jgi:hypothetical protein
MAKDADTLEKTMTRRVLRIREFPQALAVGILCAIGLFVATNWLVIKGGERVGEHLSLLRYYFVGYSVTFLGSFVGAAWAFAAGFGGTYLVSRVYNLVVEFRYGDRTDEK